MPPSVARKVRPVASNAPFTFWIAATNPRISSITENILHLTPMHRRFSIAEATEHWEELRGTSP